VNAVNLSFVAFANYGTPTPEKTGYGQTVVPLSGHVSYFCDGRAAAGSGRGPGHHYLGFPYAVRLWNVDRREPAEL